MLKKCSKCKSEKDESEFGKNKTRPDGKQIWCKGCFSEYSSGKKAKKVEQTTVLEAEQPAVESAVAEVPAATEAPAE